MKNPNLSDDNGKAAVESVLRMNSGDGPTSYAANSTAQRSAMVKVRSILEESVKRVYTKTLSSTNQFTVADLGCATGPNSLKAATTIVEAIFELCSQAGKSTPEILVFLNDLPGNDFNSIFVDLPDFYDKLKLKKKESDTKCFVSAMPGSFYGRLFPSRSLLFVHSAMSINWLSQAPDGLLEQNKGSIYMTSTTSKNVLEAYLNQFQRDFTLFLSSRAQEIIPQGEMVLTCVCRTKPDLARDKESVFLHWELLSESLVDMAADGLIEEKDIDSFNIPNYTPHEDEVRDIVKKEASFVINKLETIIGPFNRDEDTRLTAKMIVLLIRAVTEPLLTDHFGESLIMDDLFERFRRKVDGYVLSATTPIIWSFIILSATRI